MDMVKSNKDPINIVNQHTHEMQGILYMFTDNYNDLKHRSIKTRFTKLKKKLSPTTVESEGDSSNSSSIRSDL